MSGKFMMNGIEYLGGGSGGGGGNVDDVLVNGVSVVNEDKEAEIVSYKEVTQSEYEALPDTKLTDGVAYFIKDSTEAEGYPPLIYSTSEREVGVWIDGKPLYQKTLEFNNESNSDIAIDVSSLNIDKCIDTEVQVFASAGFCIGNNYYASNTDRILAYYDTRDNQKVVRVGRGSSAPKGNGVATILYTKTTDTPGGGLWAGNGAMAHHYSTEEVIVGTWIDGKPLYEKTFESTAASLGQSVTWDISELNIDKVISQSGSFCRKTSSNDIYWYDIDNVQNTNFSYWARTTVSPTDNLLYSTIDMGSGNTVLYRCVTLRYTKTTD